MKKKLLTICAKTSTILFLVFACLSACLWIFNLDLTSLYIPLGFDIKLTASRFDDFKVHEWLIFYNGPYPTYSTMAGSNVNETFYEGWGIYFKLLNNPAMKITWWTLMISLWYPIILFGILPAIFVVKKLRNRRSGSTKEATIEKRDQ